MRLCMVFAVVCIWGFITDINTQADQSARWWPKQAAPKAVVQTTIVEDAVTENLLKSLAGLTAQAVNEGRFDEMVWICDKRPDYKNWYEGVVKRLALQQRGTFEPWQLVERYKEKGLIKGYILYSYKRRHGGSFDQSLNIATSAAGILQGILVEESQQAKAEEFGLKMLLDARGKDLTWCFNTYKDRLNQNLLLAARPTRPSNRGMAIAHKAMAVYTLEEPVPTIMQWLKPVTPVLGWNDGGEDSHTGQASRYGHFTTCSGSATNMPIFSAGTENYTPPKVQSVNPATIDYDQDYDHYAAFLMSDGDSIGWTMEIMPDYYENPDHGSFAFGWTHSMGHLSQLCPEALAYYMTNRPDNVSFVEQGGGYFYPDKFAMERPNRKELLACHARNTAHYMRNTGVSVMSFICMDVDSEAALEAYAIFAREMKGLAGMIALQYYPYDGGDGEIFWFKNAEGIDIPVVCIKYSIWRHADWPRGGTPAKIARMINAQAGQSGNEDKTSYSIASVHCWSYFQKAPGNDEQAENIGKDENEYKKLLGRTERHRGVTPVKWCVQRLGSNVKVVTPDELIWRVRMTHRPKQTRSVIANMK